MAVLQMQRISICALKHDRKAILEKLQSMGMIDRRCGIFRRFQRSRTP